MSIVNAQGCVDNGLKLTINIQTDSFANETSWQLKNWSTDSLLFEVPTDTYQNNQLISLDFCLSKLYCYEFTIFDAFLDGIKAPGFYQLLLNDTLIQSGGDFQLEERTVFNCTEGAICELAPLIETGTHLTTFKEPWLAFQIDSLGSYSFSTCGINDTDTQLWIYDDCDGLLISADQAGAIYFDDNEGGCGLQAQITNAILDTARIYYLRLASTHQSFDDSIYINIKYNGPIAGCTDSSSCNYNPFATIDDGSCMAVGNPNCPGAPDLTVSQVVLQNSIFLDTITNFDNCAIEEGCLRGYGRRDIVRFSTLIQNIGEQDYYVGKLADNQGQFSEDNCHMHPHYENYAEYLLFDAFGQALPVGFKNGFCVTDLHCADGVEKKYSCANMGITAGCEDAYLSDLDCQWIDVTDLPDGFYTMAISINWNQKADLLGRVESDYLNNWAQVCFSLSRVSGQLELILEATCDTYVDCSGQPFGKSQADCKGTCNGSAITGDIDANGVINEADVNILLGGAANLDLHAEPCYDLNNDEIISVFDAALLNACFSNRSGHTHENGLFHPDCNFPKGLEKKQDSIYYTFANVNYESFYFDLHLWNPTNNLQGFQIQLSGATIDRIENISTVMDTVIRWEHSIVQNSVAVLIEEGNVLDKSASFQPVLRIYYSALDNDSLCLVESFTESISEKLERLNSNSSLACIPSRDPVNVWEIVSDFEVSVFPNPAQSEIFFQWENPQLKVFLLCIRDLHGKLFYESVIKNEMTKIQTDFLPSGIYIYKLSNESGFSSGRFIKI